MKPTKARNYQIYRAPHARRSKQLGSPLSQELRKKYGKRSMRVILGDTVKVLRGEYRGIDGKVSKISTQSGNLAIEGVKKEKSKGEKFDVLIKTSKVIITGLNLDDHWRKTKLQGKEPKTTPKETKKELIETKKEEPKETKKELIETKKEEPKETKKELIETKKEEPKKEKIKKEQPKKPGKTKKKEPKKVTKSKPRKKKKDEK